MYTHSPKAFYAVPGGSQLRILLVSGGGTKYRHGRSVTVACTLEMLPPSPSCAVRLSNLVRKDRGAADQGREFREQ